MPALVIGVNYRTDEHAVRFAHSLAQYFPEDVSAILVDNSERSDPDGFSRRIHETNPQIRCLQAPCNLGYFGGANYGLNQYLASSELPDWVIVCNVDIEFLDSRFFSTLRELESTRSLGVVAPRIWSARWKRDLNPKISERPTRRRMLFYRIVLGNYYLQTAYEFLSILKNALRTWTRLLRARFSGDQEHEKTSHIVTSIYAPHGSCMIHNKRYFTAGGSLEYSVFLFGEEIFVAETVKKLGLTVGYCPQLWVLDNEHASTGIIRSRKTATYLKEATRYLAETFFTARTD